MSDQAAHEQLARRLSAMKLKDVRKEIRALDSGAILKYYRNAIWGEYHTLWVLPNAGLSITLVERADVSDSNKEVGGGPRGMTAKKVEYVYIETRVEPLLRPAYRRGETGPAAAAK
ncbi:MAG: hypothetical protein KJ047_06850 [Anaerolineae bacterium]|nr:hypothetical protein [Anaerolineae bacterium]MEB2289025.1 hypothetical protein [Anaerolineae bacterium]